MITNTAWKEFYAKDNYPFESSTVLEDFWPSDIRNVFVTFSNEMGKRFGLNLASPTYTKQHGWKFKFNKSGIALIKNVVIGDDCFYIDHVCVQNDTDIPEAVRYVESLYTEDFLAKFEERISLRNKRQVERSKRRVEREEAELAAFSKRVDTAKLNKFKWAPKVPRQYFIRLYKSDAQMMIDEELLNEVGFMLYVRCLQGKEESDLARKRMLKCHNCGIILAKPQDELITCNCGYSYIFREYMRSYHKNKMPRGAAAPFFDKFMDDWPKMKTSAEKMRLIDWVIHECHLNMLSGVKRGFAGINLIEGTKKQVCELINELAYGNVG